MNDDKFRYENLMFDPTIRRGLTKLKKEKKPIFKISKQKTLRNYNQILRDENIEDKLNQKVNL